MRISRQISSMAVLAGILLPALLYSGGITEWIMRPSAADIAALVPARSQTYEVQKVVYHLHEGADWLGRRHVQRLTNLNHHLDALDWQDGNIVAVLAGEGLDLLTAASRNTELGQRVDALRRRGVRFLICRNTMLGRRIGPERIHGFRQEDVVNAGLPEIVRLMQQGYTYIRL